MSVAQDLSGPALPADPAVPAEDEVGRYPISEVVERTGLSAHTLRWYERIGLLPQVGREASRSGGGQTGRRLYSERDLAFLAFVGKLRATGMPVAEMIQYGELAREGAHTIEARRQMLIAHRAEVRERIADLTACLMVLDCKVELYTRLRDESGVPQTVPTAD
ncbi:MerR family transcriptional regulator [Yinghuangia seranimata]|uniref:MerR family transcriptional regulator n=1 Tax=Yinghuangia seranimata TaxID=408067 RepID=UPI00248C3462|nr:MerR family transcriptional regulator [Yinghuangia seranimata]MDI2129231.1 MerR family transcriptional regulator [Yinghuangia seranimata]